MINIYAVFFPSLTGLFVSSIERREIAHWGVAERKNCLLKIAGRLDSRKEQKQQIVPASNIPQCCGVMTTHSHGWLQHCVEAPPLFVISR